MPHFHGVNCFLFESDLWLPRQPSQVFEFFADARNLQALTPDWLDFSITTQGAIAMRAGAMIDYKLRVHGLPIRWRTEITVWDPPGRFVDEQRRGPYKLWVHEHCFVERNGGTDVFDKVHYLPRGGWIMDRLFVRRDIERIFEYRRKRLLEKFTRPLRN